MLSEVEEDFFGDMAADDHGVWEIFEFLRGSRPTATDLELYEAGREILRSWLGRGWLVVVDQSGATLNSPGTDELVEWLDHLGPVATRYFDGAPWLRLAEKAYEDMQWSKPAT